MQGYNNLSTLPLRMCIIISERCTSSFSLLTTCFAGSAINTKDRSLRFQVQAEIRIPGYSTRLAKTSLSTVSFFFVVLGCNPTLFHTHRQYVINIRALINYYSRLFMLIYCRVYCKIDKDHHSPPRHKINDIHRLCDSSAATKQQIIKT